VIFLQDPSYRDELESLLIRGFVPAGYKINKNIELDSVPESSKYDALFFTLNEQRIVYRKGKVTPDRPGAFLTVWQRPALPTIKGNKPIPLRSNQLDYLFVKVEDHSNIMGDGNSINNPKYGMFIFPVLLLIEKGIVSTENSKGKTGFRVFPPWSQDRGVVATNVFSESGKKTQRWQLPYFLEFEKDGLINPSELNKLLEHKKIPT
jgi:hypothetical protein